MGWCLVPYCPSGTVWDHDNNDKVLNTDEFKYHNSWDWLIPVVEKIENTPNKSYEYEFVKHGKRYVAIVDVSTNIEIIVINITTENSFMEATWLLVVEFIKFITWYKGNN